MRTQKNIVDYFPHDTNASDGDTITILEGLFGNDGYALWFKLLEKLGRTENHYININQNSKWQLFCSKAHIPPEKAITIVEKLVELEAIDKNLWDKGIIWSENLVKNLASVYKNRRRGLPQKPISTNSNDISTSNIGKTTRRKAITTQQSRVEYSKVKYSIVLPDFIDKEIWDDYLKSRKKPTERAIVLLIRKLEEFRNAGDDPNEVLKRSIMNGWTGIFPLDKKGDRDGAHKQDFRQPPRDRKYTRPEDL